MKVLVTGAAGFIGSHLCERLLARKDCVVGLDDFNDYYDPARKRENWRQVRRRGTARLVEADIRDVPRVERLFRRERPEVVVHLAARAGVRPSLTNPLLYESVNCGGTLVLLEAARRHGVRRFVFGSSSSVYGDTRGVPFRETQRCDRQASPYGATKRAGELYVRTYHRLYGLQAVCLRFFTVYGPRQRPDMAIHKFALRILHGESIPYFGDGRSRRDYTYIDDILQGILGAIDASLDFEIVNLGESETISLRRMVRHLEEALDRPALIERLPAQPGDVRVTCADVTRARRVLGYRPSVPFAEGIRRFAQWVRQENTPKGRRSH